MEEWPASPLERINELEPVRYLGVQIRTEMRTCENGSTRKVFTVGQSAHVKDVFRSCGMDECHATQLPVPREWIELNRLRMSMSRNRISAKKLYRRHNESLVSKTKPDLLFTTSHMAMVLSQKPMYVSRVRQRVLSYSAGTRDVRLTLGPMS